jgi:tetratricopeptide (TPR) repeat protein
MFMMFRGRLMEARDLMEQALPQLRRWGTALDVSWGLWILGQNTGWLGDQGWTSNFKEGLAIAYTSGHRWMEAFVAARMADFLAFYSNDPQVIAENWDQLMAEATVIAEELDNPFLLINVFLVKGNREQFQGHYERAEPYYERALAETRRINHLWLMSMAYRDSGRTTYQLGNFSLARKYYEEMRLLVRRMGARSMEAHLLIFMGNLARAEGEVARALEYFRAGLDLMEETGAATELYWCYSYLGHTLLAQHQVEQAAINLNQCLLGINSNTDRNLVGMALAGVSGVLAARGRAKDAARLAGAARVQFLAIPRRLDPVDRGDWERIQAEVRAQLDEASFASAWAEGQAMSPEQAIAYALEETEAKTLRAREPSRP